MYALPHWPNLVLRVQAGAMLCEQLHHRRMTILGGNVQRPGRRLHRASARVSLVQHSTCLTDWRIHASSVLEKQLQNWRMSSSHGNMEGSQAILRARQGIHASRTANSPHPELSRWPPWKAVVLTCARNLPKTLCEAASFGPALA